ncbi:MAG: DUF4258 domain-containing protein [Dehalococcoidia bacterium]|nr:DUF4258 domain-containing protein [Dehalococcoidia bacterium]
MRLVYSDHATRRMFERRIGAQDIRMLLESGEVAEEYEETKSLRSRLVVGRVSSRHLHAVVADDTESGVTIVVTAYEPSVEEWLPPDFKRRRRQR